MAAIARHPLSRLHHAARHPALRLLATTALTTPLLALPALAQNLPTGASVAAGSVSIAQPSATQMTITQSSASAVINYNAFSIGAGSAVNIQQPSVNAALLNRVTGDTPSTIAGSLTANGQVYLVNPNGIAITRSGTVNVGGGFVASTLGISDSDFMSGKRTFSGNGASANVSNAGTIRVGRGGYAALIGGTVDNSGSIEVPLGKVGLGSGERATLDFAGDGFLQVAAPTKSGGTDALVRHSGRIRADGGSVVITAATAREAARNAVNISGHVQARSISGHSGSIFIGGGAGGRVRIGGKLNVASRKGKGGNVTVTGHDIALNGATINASGQTGGGSVKIGGDRQGQGSLQRAATTTIDVATTIQADAIATGNGGNVVVWSDQLTTFAGTISAKGGSQSGNGGEAEVSGKATLAYTGFTDLSAANGNFGTLLLDPYNVTISNGADTLGSGPTFTANANDSVINAGTLQNALAGANVTVSTGGSGTQTGDITVSAPVTWSSGSLLTLSAFHSLAINAPITITGPGKLALKTDQGGSGGTLTFAGGVQYTGTPNSGQSLTINGNAYQLLYSMSDVQTINNGLTGNYALAKSLDATGVTGFTPLGTNGSGTVLNSGNGFTGSFTGLGNTISNLTVSSYFNAALFGYSSGTISDIGLLGSMMNGSFYLGGLVGYQAAGSIANAYATGTMAGYTYVGGLVGYQSGGSVSQAWASGAVSGYSALGGLVGYQAGSISQAYAIGTVTGSQGVIGGLVGYQAGGSISQAWASGAVTGSGAYVGGLVGGQVGGSIANSYFDLYSTGQANAVGGGSGGTVANVSAVTSDPAQSAAANYAYKQSAYGYLTFTTTPGGSGWFMIDGQTRPFGAWEYSQNISNSHQLQLVNMDLNASYQLARNIDLAGEFGRAGVASPTAAQSAGMWNGGFVPLGTNGAGTILNSNSGFTGSFTGLGHTISNLTVDIGSYYNAGLFGYGSGAISDIGLVGGSVNGGFYTGGLIGWQTGGSITQAYTTGKVTGSVNVGGLVGYQSLGSSITQAYASGTVSGSSSVGGLVGGSNGSITQAYASGTVAGSSNVGGLVGWKPGGNISQAYATGAVTGGSNVGGLVGTQAGGGITNSYFDTDTTGRSTSNGVGNTPNASGVAALSSTSGTAFVNSNYVGFDQTVWSPASAAVGATPAYYPQLYGVSGVVGVKYSDATITYVGATPAFGAPSAVYGIGTFNTWTTAPGAGSVADVNAGIHAITTTGAAATFTPGGPSRIVYPGTLTITPAPLTITALDATKTYGQTATLTGFTTSALQNGESVGSVSLSSSGVAATAGVTGSPYAITPSAASGGTFNPANYAITYIDGHLTVNPATLTITANNASKTYGQTTTFAGTEFTSTGLQNGETIASVGLSSPGAAATANVTGSPYVITASGATGGTFNAANYSISYANGNLTVNPATLTITANNASKTYGQTTTFTGTEFIATGLKNSETIGSVTLSSLGAASTANVLGSPYAIVANGAIGGTFNAANYTVTYADGQLTVNPTALTITANNTSKTYGQTTTFAGIEFTTSGLQNSETIGSVTLSSLGAASTASVSGSPYAIVANGATGGTFNAANYTLNYADGQLTVNAALLTITANNASKTYGQTTTFTGTEFIASGLKNSETIGSVTLSSLGAASTASVSGSPYVITANGATGGTFNAANYAINYANGSLTVNPAALTIMADAQSREEGRTNPALTYRIDGTLFNGDTIAGSLATEATIASSPGAYPITQGTLTASANYVLSYQGALLTVTPGAIKPPPAIDFALWASTVVFDSFDPVNLPDNAHPVIGAPNIVTSHGTGVLYADPRFDAVFVCFAGGYGTAQSCFAAGR